MDQGFATSCPVSAPFEDAIVRSDHLPTLSIRLFTLTVDGLFSRDSDELPHAYEATPRGATVTRLY
jgi:hypothetical protein